MEEVKLKIHLEPPGGTQKHSVGWATCCQSFVKDRARVTLDLRQVTCKHCLDSRTHYYQPKTVPGMV